VLHHICPGTGNFFLFLTAGSPSFLPETMNINAQPDVLYFFDSIDESNFYFPEEMLASNDFSKA
jgi:hypothetical protein